MRFAYLAVEGPQDVAFIARLLKPHQFTRVTKLDQLDPYWAALVPRTFPNKQGDLNQPVAMPQFFKAGDMSVAVQATGGDSKIVPLIMGTLAVLPPAPLEAVGAILDADSSQTPLKRFLEVRKELLQLEDPTGVKLTVPPQPGLVSAASPRCGVFVLPDNQTEGTLEDILLECAGTQYPTLLQGAKFFVDAIQLDDPAFVPEDMREFKKPAGRKKATVASICGVLKPGRALQVSLQDNRWLEGPVLALTRVVAVSQFLKNLLALP